MVNARSAGASVSPAEAMVMNTRANACDVSGAGPGAGGFAFGSGGSSEGHRKTRSTRSWLTLAVVMGGEQGQRIGRGYQSSVIRRHCVLTVASGFLSAAPATELS